MVAARRNRREVASHTKGAGRSKGRSSEGRGSRRVTMAPSVGPPPDERLRFPTFVRVE